MSSFTTEGFLSQKFADQVISERFTKREFILEIEDGNYPQHIKFQLTQERCDLIDAYKEGEKIRVHFNLRGKPFQNRQGETVYFTNLEVWKIEAVGAQKPAAKPAASTQRQAALPPPPPTPMILIFVLKGKFGTRLIGIFPPTKSL